MDFQMLLPGEPMQASSLSFGTYELNSELNISTRKLSWSYNLPLAPPSSHSYLLSGFPAGEERTRHQLGDYTSPFNTRLLVCRVFASLLRDLKIYVSS